MFKTLLKKTSFIKESPNRNQVMLSNNKIIKETNRGKSMLSNRKGG